MLKNLPLSARIATLAGLTVTLGLLLVVAVPPVAKACGGFFCQAIPINQAGEQIIFRRDGDMITAVVLIQYAGEAEDFSWVVPVPGIPEITVGSDVVFQPLELATRPQFNLTIEGSSCDPFPIPLGGFAASPTSDSLADEEVDNGVTVVDRFVSMVRGLKHGGGGDS